MLYRTQHLIPYSVGPRFPFKNCVIIVKSLIKQQKVLADLSRQELFLGFTHLPITTRYMGVNKINRQMVSAGMYLSNISSYYEKVSFF